MAEALLKVDDLHGHYGESHVLHGMSFEVHPGEVVTLLGRNGAGKTTTMRAIMGLLRKRAGSIVYEGTETVGLQPNKIARLGIALCPEERGIFASLNVRGKPAAATGGEARRPLRGRDPRTLPPPARAAQQPGHQAFRRRAADAGHRPHPAHGGEISAAGRAHGRARPGDRAAHR